MMVRMIRIGKLIISCEPQYVCIYRDDDTYDKVWWIFYWKKRA